MKVSVIVPTLDAEPWITQQLDMLLSQTVKAEILVIDSGSTDGFYANDPLIVWTLSIA